MLLVVSSDVNARVVLASCKLQPQKPKHQKEISGETNGIAWHNQCAVLMEAWCKKIGSLALDHCQNKLHQLQKW